MDDMKALFEKMRAKMDMVRSVFGEENLAAVPLFENCLCYPMDLLTELAGMACEIEELDSPEEISSRLEAFRELRLKIENRKQERPRLMLWRKTGCPL
ncbi:MAG: hypothetical protein ACLVLH_11500 [Eisenbergiella massiliensis]